MERVPAHLSYEAIGRALARVFQQVGGNIDASDRGSRFRRGDRLVSGSACYVQNLHARFQSKLIDP